MTKFRKIKFYFHNDSYVHLQMGVKKKSGFFLKALGAFFSMFYEACFKVGSFVINSYLFLLRKVEGEVEKTFFSVSKRFKALKSSEFSTSILIFVVVCSLTAVGFKSASLVAKGLEIKDRVLNSARLGGQELIKATQALQEQNFAVAENKFALASKSFENGQTQLEETGKLINTITNVLPQKKDAQRILDAAALMSESGKLWVSFSTDLEKLKISPEGVTSSENVPEVLNRIEKSLQTLNKNIAQASEKISKVNPKNLPEEYKGTFLELQNNLTVVSGAFNSVQEVFSIFKQIASGKKNILLLFQNNNELRASGGFLGTYGSIELNNGKMEKLVVSSIYDLDGQLKENILPPTPVLNVNNRWFLRDSNWFAHFPESAKKITSFYEKEGGETPDLIIALTPNFIVDLLKLTGPITLPTYGLVLDSENFIEQIQFASTLSQAQPTNSPKQVLADLVPLLLQKVNELPKEQWPVFLEKLQENLWGKQIVFFSKDKNLQTKFASFSWTGELLKSERDYVSVVNSNLGGTKTDLFVKQATSLVSNIEADGSIINELAITRENTLPELENTNNLSFLRIYVPEGSELLSNTGFMFKPVPDINTNEYKTDSSVLQWEKKLVREGLSGTVIGKESGKTFFGNWVEVKGGETKTVKLTYRLPFKLKKIDRHSLLVQKQLGALNESFDYTLKFSGRKVEWKNIETKLLDTSELNTSLILNKDYLLGLVLSSN